MFTELLPEYYFAFLVFAVILLYILGTLPVVFECFSLRRERNKFLDKIHVHERELKDLKKKIKSLKEENKDLLALNYSRDCVINSLSRENCNLKDIKEGEN